MNSISHEKARQYLHLRREGLEAGERQAMEAHLFLCEDCRRYDRKLAALERDLGHSFHNRLDPVPTPVGMAGKVQVCLDRAKRNRLVLSLAGSLAGALALVALLVFLVELFSSSRLPPAAESPIPADIERVREFARRESETPAAPNPVSTDAVLSMEDVPPTIPGGQLIAFTSRRDGNEEIYVMNTDGSDPTNLTNHPAADNFPLWSPDGQRLAFVSDRSGKPEVYLMYDDGSGLVQLTDLPNVEGFWWLSCSPDGTRLAAEVLLTYPVTGELYGRIFLIQADGSGVFDLTHNELPARVYDPLWSPAGDWIAYVRGGPAPTYLRLIRPDGTEDQALNRSIRNTPSFAWSPDGVRIAYFTSCMYCEVYDNEPADLRLAGLDGSEPETLYRFEELSLDFFGLSWSPEGSYLAFTANEGKDSIRHLSLFGMDDKEVVDVAAFEPADWFISVPSWSPDGAQIVFDTGQEEERDIYVADLEARLRGEVGAGITNLTAASPGPDYQPQWQP